MLTPIAKKWETTGLFSDLTSDTAKNKLGDQFELVIGLVMNDPQANSLVIEGVIPAIRLIHLRNKAKEPSWVYEDFKSWLETNKVTDLSPALIESYVTQLA